MTRHRLDAEPDTAAPPLDLRLLPAAAAAWAAAWLGPVVGVRAAVLGAAVLGTAALALARRGSTALMVSAALAVGAAAGLGAAARVVERDAGPIAGLAVEHATATVNLRITGDPAVRAVVHRFAGPGQVVLVPARVTQVAARGQVTATRTRVLLIASDTAWRDLIPGQELRVSGRFAPPRPREPTAAILRVSGPPAGAITAPLRDRAAADVRAGLRSAVDGLGRDQRGLVPGLVLGDTSGLPPDLEQDFRDAGLSHTTAVSGSNLSLLLAAVLGLARLAGARLRALPVIALATAVVFILVARPEPSLLRASVMGLIGVLGLAAGRPGRAAPALCAAVVLLLFADPWLARSFGMALSVAATAGLITLAPRWRDRLAVRLPSWLATALAVPAAAQTTCAPVVVLLASEVSLVAVAANLLAVPAVPPAMLLGVLAAITWPVCPPLARCFGELAGLPAWWIVQVARRAADVPGATVPWPGGLRGALALGLLTFAVAVVLRHRRAALLATALALLLLLRPAVPLPSFLRGGWPPPGWILVACDIGQGDALALNAGPGAAVVVDAGPDPDAVDRCLRRLGVRQVPYLLITHPHADHVDGLAGVVRGRRVAEIGIGPTANPPVGTRAIPVTRPAAGERRSLGALSWRVLWPQRLIDEGALENNASIVLLVEVSGVRVLLTGDIEPPAQAALRRAEPALQADVLKIPHHGSSHQDPEFLAGLGARLAIASAGRGNDYGHPAPVTLRLLEGRGVRVLRTDADGDIAVVVQDGRLGVAR